MKLTRYEQETIYSDTFKCIKVNDISKTYEMPKSAVTYRKPRKISEAKREQARNIMKAMNQIKNTS